MAYFGTLSNIDTLPWGKGISYKWHAQDRGITLINSSLLPANQEFWAISTG
jgi:hypothetical protein